MVQDPPGVHEVEPPPASGRHLEHVRLLDAPFRARRVPTQDGGSRRDGGRIDVHGDYGSRAQAQDGDAVDARAASEIEDPSPREIHAAEEPPEPGHGLSDLGLTDLARVRRPVEAEGKPSVPTLHAFTSHDGLPPLPLRLQRTLERPSGDHPARRGSASTGAPPRSPPAGTCPGARESAPARSAARCR